MIIRGFVVSSHTISQVSAVKQACMFSSIAERADPLVRSLSPTFNHVYSRQVPTCH